VLATSAPVAAQLAGLDAPRDALRTTAVYFAGQHPLYHSRKIALNATPDAFVNNAQQLSNVAPSYAPPGRHLLSATILDVPDLTDGEIVIATMRDLRRMWAGDTQAQRALDSYYPLHVYRIDYAQFPQPPGVYGTRPPHTTDQPGLFIAGDWTTASSIHGAMSSGEQAAAAVGQALRAAAV
jgi:phytoene dehydrogenase-like protein